MANQLVCDGCGATITRDANRLRLLVIRPANWFEDLRDGNGMQTDFCHPGCLATWAVEQEATIIQNMHD